MITQLRYYTLILIILLAIVIESCVPNRKYVYLQKDDLKVDIALDSVVRTYSIDRFNYKIQPNDALYVRFVSLTDEKFDFLANDDFSGGGGNGQGIQLRSELVDEKGEIGFPEIGKVKVSGLSVFQIEDKLQAIANEYLNAPIVKVRLVNFRFTVLGEVDQEGTFTSLNNRVSVAEAIGIAGGLGDLADRSKIKVIRQHDGVAKVSYINLLSEDIINSPYFYLNQNDIIIVSSLRQRPFRQYFGQNLSIFLSSLSLLLLVINLSK